MPVKSEHVIQRNGKDYVLYAGLLNAAHEEGLKGISTTIVQIGSVTNGNITIVHATVEMKEGQLFMGLGDVGPNDSNKVALGAPLRMAETRAKARALRDALNIGYLLEGEDDEPSSPAQTPPSSARAGAPGGGGASTSTRSNGSSGSSAAPHPAQSTSPTHVAPTVADEEAEHIVAVERGQRLLREILKIREDAQIITPTPDEALWTDLSRLRALYLALARDNRERGLATPV